MKKKKTKLFLCIITIFLNIGIGLSQNSFKKFMDKFPSKTWNDLPLFIEEVDRREKTIDVDTINKYFFANSAIIQKYVKGNNDYTLPSPHIILFDGNYAKGEGGKFSKTHNDKTANIYPICKIELNKGIIIFCLLYSSAEYNSYELYTYNSITNKLLSSLRLNETGKNIFPAASYIEYDFMITKIVIAEVENLIRTYYIEYQINDSGYIQQVNEEILITPSSHVIRGFIIDEEEKTNIYKNPTDSSETLYTVENNTYFIINNISEDWYKVIYCKNAPPELKKKYFKQGYINKSQVNFKAIE